ncbi:alpha/beta hydrolase [Kineococcus sp. G2]|uniref:alpha/beta hydrolase n=1 Tax=Kineococcus sp. G2 TaxID=3127484 RepID=UPI00301E4D49
MRGVPERDLLERDERARPWSERVPGARAGVVVVHGFTSTPQSVHGWARAFADAGCSVDVPLLPGHGRTVAACNASTWPQWLAEVVAALRRLREHHDVVVVAGISLGGALALRAAQLHPELVDGLVLANPATGLTRPLELAVEVLGRVRATRPAIAGDIAAPGVVELAYERTPLRALRSQAALWRHVRRDLPLVRQPVLLLRSAVDHVLPPSSSARVLASVSSADVTEVVHRDSFHVLTLDRDAPAAFAESVAFVRRLADGLTPGPPGPAGAPAS